MFTLLKQKYKHDFLYHTQITINHLKNIEKVYQIFVTCKILIEDIEV